jgi:uncharacterized membrane protein (UPF0127 family)
MLTNETRRELLNRAKASGFPGSIIDVFQAADQGIDLIEQHQMQQQQEQEMQVANTPEQQETGLREQHAMGNTQASMAFPDVQPNQSFNTVGMQAPIDIQKIDDQGHLVESYKNVPPGIQDLPTGPSEGTVIESPAAYQKGGVKEEFPGLLPEVEVSALKDKSYNKLSDSQKQVYDSFVTPGGTAQTVNIGGDREMHWKNALQMVKDVDVNISNTPEKNIFGYDTQKVKKEGASKGDFRAHANRYTKEINVPSHQVYKDRMAYFEEKHKEQRREMTEEDRLVYEKKARQLYFDNIIAESAHMPEFYRKESLWNLPISRLRDLGRLFKGVGYDKGAYSDPHHIEYKTHVGPDSFEEKLRSKYEIKQKGGFNFDPIASTQDQIVNQTQQIQITQDAQEFQVQQEKDLEELSDWDFKDKYSTSKHAVKMSINPEYAAGFQGRGDIGGGTVKSYYDKFTGNNPNLQWISGASNQMYASPEQKQKTQDYHQNWIGAVTPIPIVEGIALTAKGAKLPGLLPSTFKTIKAVPKRGTTLNKFGQIKTSFDDVLKDATPIDQATGKPGGYLVREGNVPLRGSGKYGKLNIQVFGQGTDDFIVMAQKVGEIESGMQLLSRIDVPNGYYIDMTMSNTLEAGHTMKYLEEFMPKGSTISSRTSLSFDSYKLMLNRVKRGKFSIVDNIATKHYTPNPRMDLNMMSKRITQQVKNKELTMNKAGWVSKADADKLVKDLNKMLSDSGIKDKARAIKADKLSSGELSWKVDVPNLTLKMEYQKGGFKSKYQVGGFNSADINPTPYNPLDKQFPLRNTPFPQGRRDINKVRREELRDAIDLVVSYEPEEKREDVRKLLTVTNFMENSMGHNPEAYSREYTNSQASIDHIRLDDLFDKRKDKDGNPTNYSQTQKDYFKWFKELGLPTDKEKFKEQLNSDNPLAAVAAMRMTYGRSKDPIPTVSDTADMFTYYDEQYRKNVKIKDKTKSEERFIEGYKTKFKRGGYKRKYIL